MQCLIAQDYPKGKLEIVIIDDGSTDGTAALAIEAAEGTTNFRVIQAPPPPSGVSPKKNALMTGIEATTGEVILTTDADCRPGPHWVKNIAGYFEEGVNAVVGHSPLRISDFGLGSSAIRNPQSAFRLASFDSFINAVVAAGTIGLGVPTTAVGRNFAYRRSAFEAVGGFGSSLSGASGDDDLLLQRIAAPIPNSKFQIPNFPIRFAISPASFVPASGAATILDWLRVKRRHLSAGKRYSPGLITLATPLYLFNVGLLGLLALAAFGLISFWWLVGLWGAKALADGITLGKGAQLLNEKRWFSSWLVAELISPVIFTIMVPLSLVGKVTWKGRELGR